MICFLANFFNINIFVLYFLYFSSYLSVLMEVLMEEYSREDRLASIEAKLDFLIHHLDPRIHIDSLMERGILPYQGSLNPTF